MRLLAFSSGEESVTVSDMCWAWALAKPFCMLPAPRRCVMSAGAARRLRWQHRAAWSLLLLLFFVVLPLLVFMAQGELRSSVLPYRNVLVLCL